MTTATTTTTASPWNVPNLLTSIRFILAVLVIALIAAHWFGWALAGFLIAASTDWVDGFWARRYGQVTKVGRIFDPFVDKIVICGAFIALVEVDGLAAWMAIVVVARELLVTSLRGLIEGAGGDFSASPLGKWKMVLQCAAVAAVLTCLIDGDPPAWLYWTQIGALWAAVALTVFSGFDYVVAAARVIRDQDRPLRNADGGE